MSTAYTTVVAISRQFGSGAHAISRMVALQLGIPLLDNEIINRAAAAAGVEPDVIIAAESVPSMITRIVEQLGRYPTALEPEGLATTVLPPNLMLSSSDYRHLIDHVVREYADQQSCVILGHGAAQTLAGRPGVLGVFIVAPFDVRVRRHAHDQGLSEQKSHRQVRENDRERAEFFRHYYNNMDWNDARRYDLTINSGTLSDALASELIVRAAQSRQYRELPDHPTPAPSGR